jgi:hypothetical protein
MLLNKQIYSSNEKNKIKIYQVDIAGMILVTKNN